jgi:acyl-CoA synthetase (NDP forming)
MAPTDRTGRPTTLRELDLDRFFAPSTVAVLGASGTEGRPTTGMWRQIRRWAERAGAVAHPVNPKFDEIDGIAAFATIAEVPGDIDLAVILVADVLGVIDEVLDRKPAFAVIFGAGFAEAGAEGAKLQRRLEKRLARSSTRVLGPNTNLNAFETFRDDLVGPAIALITQSGHQGRPVVAAQELGVRISHWAPTGNESDLEVADFVRYFADLPDTGAIAAYVEGFKDGRTLMLAADHAAAAGVPFVCVKVGRTDAGASMAKSHTGHLTGSDRVVSDVFRQFGVTRVDGLDELTDVSVALARSRPPDDPKRRAVCVYAISGGTGAHMADLAAAAGLRLPKLTKDTQRVLRRHIPDYLRVSNPVDSGGHPSGDEVAGPEILDAVCADPEVDLVIVPITGSLGPMSTTFAGHIVDAAERTDIPIFVVWGSPVDEPAYREVLCRSSRITTFRTFSNCVRAAAAFFDHHEVRARYRSPFTKSTRRRSPAAAAVADLLVPGATLSEPDSKQVLAAYGIATTRERLATSADLAAKAARRMSGPVVMKIASPDIAHKSDHGLVVMGVDHPSDVRATFDRLYRRAAKRLPGARVQGVLVCETAPPGVEVMLGVTRDPTFGPTIAFGLGGVFVEVLDDVATRVPPFGQAEARRMVEQIRGAPLLHGARGSVRADVGALVDAVMKVQRLVLDHADVIDEIDVNPLVVTADGAIALDAMISCR